MDEYPEDEDFDAMHAEEMEMMRDMEDFNHDDEIVKHVPPTIKRNLQFASPESTRISKIQQTQDNNTNENNQTVIPEENVSTLNMGKRTAPIEFDDDLNEFLSDNFMENKSKKKKVALPNINLIVKDPNFDLAQHEHDLSIIEMIVEERDRRRRNQVLETKTEVKKISHEARVYRHVPEGAFQALTTESGKRFYLTVLEEEQWEEQLKYIANTQKCIHLLNTPYSQLKRQAEKEQERQDLRRQTSLEPVDDSGTESGIDDEDEESSDKSLWVEQYKPRHYLDLLSDEATNRCVLQWMKLWDKLAFGRERKVKIKKEEPPKDDKGFFKKKFFPRNAPEVLEEWDEHGRPVQKVILMSGPPGLGKTTLAHIIARHAGYNVVEMNASDDRSADTFKTNLENATSMRSVIGKDPRPNCLIIDEIDGAPAPSINLLVNMLQGKDMGKKPKKKGAKDGPKLMQRPVLCICNDVFTPALRPLKMMALVIQFLPTQTSKLAQRLFDIARKRHLKTDLTVLMALCDKTENDIRSCLSALQFIRATKKKVMLDDVESVSVGQKDYQRSLFNVWHDMFSIPRFKKKRRINPHEVKHQNGVLVAMPENNEDIDNFERQSTLASRFKRILHTTQSCGEYDKLTQGWFENYLTIKFKHAFMEPVSDGLSWAEFTDTINLQILRGQNWNLMAYLPYACVAYHLRFAGNAWPKISFPKQLSDLSTNRAKSENLMTSMVSEMSPHTRVFVSVTTLVQDLLPFLLHIIQPNLRPVNTQLYSKAEKQELYCLLDTMISYNLTYTQERTPEGQYLFTLDPNVEDVVRFPDIKPSKQLTYAARNLISREVEMEKVRRSEAYFAAQITQSQKASSIRKVGASNKLDSNIGQVPEKQTKEATSSSAVIPNHLQKLEARKINETDGAKAAKDFFGRVIPLEIQNQIATKKNEDRYNNEIVKSDIWFRFKEGFSNAVRRTIKMKDL
ncbi:unnamed protein product [Meganyctiphanes norvegica]|uniref:AAA+ ATPase domain-containing protein n=1 Tax=Meganyctiphanes norvegica TaxID=48144 RepID=A0AAV2RXW7_MEGNR